MRAMWISLPASGTWEQVIDSEYVIAAFSTRIRSEDLSRIYNWAQNAGPGPRSLAGNVFEVYLHRLATDNALELSVSEYDPPTARKPDGPRHFGSKQLILKKGAADCTGTADDHEHALEAWRNNEKLTYWLPNCHDFPNIDSIVLPESASGMKSKVAYLQITVADEHKINGKQLEKMNKNKIPYNVENDRETERPIYVAVCPNIESAKNVVLKPDNQATLARKTCRVYVGYFQLDRYAIIAGSKNNVPVRSLPPPHAHNLRK